MCLRNIFIAIIANLILILPTPAIVDLVALADSGKPLHGKAITVQPGEEVIVTDIVSGPSPQEAQATGLDATGGKDTVRNLGIVRADAEAGTTATTRGASAGSRSVGINGRGGMDSIFNSGTLSSRANSTITSLSLFINIDGFTLPFMRKFPTVTGGSLAESFATGILGGNGNDSIEHSGIMTVEATSTAAAGSINVNLTGKNEKLLSKAIPAIWAVKPPVMKADAPVKAVSEAVGIDGGRGDDRILSTGAMTVKASATSGAGSLKMNLGNDARANLSAEATATALGIRALEGKDEVVNQGVLTIEASATAGAGAVSATYPNDRGIYGLPERPPATSKVQIPIFKVQEDLSGKATAFATGIESGAADARIVNSGPIVSKASATAAAGSIAVGVGDSVEGSVAAISRAESRGIRSGSGSDVVLNSGEQMVDAKAIAGAGSISVGVRNSEQTTDPSKVKADASGTAESFAAGIETGGGADLISNTAAMSVKASSTVGAGSIAVGIGGGTDSNVSAEAMARAAGIRGGEGNDTIRNEGTLSVETNSTAGAGSIGVGVSGGGEGKSASAKADASGKTNALSVGISGGSGDDAIVNIAPINVRSSATTGAGSISVGVGMGAEGNVSAEAMARAAGIRGGEGNDTIRNEGTLMVESSSIAGAGSIGVGVSGGGEGESATAKADASAKATASALGIGGGPGHDAIFNIAPVNVIASAITGSGSISVGVGMGAEGNVSAESVARAAGIRGGEGNDTIRNEGTLSVETSSIAGAGSIGVGVSGGGEGESATAKADASAKTMSTSVGISGGSGDDAVVNIAPVSVRAGATTGAGSISVGVGMGAEGNVSAEAVARAAGIRGGEGNDTIRNEGTLAVEAASIAGAGSIGVGVSGGGEGESAKAKVDASAKASAAALGIGGGPGHDTILNIAPMDVRASATVGAGAISVSVGGDVQGNASAETITRTAGIRGGDGNDEIVNQGELYLTARSVAVAGSISVGADSGGGEKGQNGSSPEPPSLETSSAEASASAVSKALAAGIDGGEGDNRITNTAPMTVASTAKTLAGSIAVKVSGFGGGDNEGGGASGGGQEKPEMPELALSSAKTDASSKAEARAAGIRAGGGADTIANSGDITVNATSTAVAAGVSVNVAKVDKGLSGSAALADARAAALSIATGIDGGDGDNWISNSAAIGAKASTTAVGVGVSVDVGIAEKGAALGAAIADSRTTADSLAAGIRSGAGQDQVINTGVITPDAAANATAVSVGLTVTNADKGLAASAALVDANAVAAATARGIETGAGDDVILNEGAIAPKAKATTTAVGVSVGVGVTKQGVSLGASLAESNTASTAAAVGIDSGSGNDNVSNAGQVTLDSRSSGTAVSVGLSVTYAKQGVGASAAMVDARSTADATAQGIAAGDGDDTINNSGTIQGIARADTTSVGVAVGVGIAKQGVAIGVGLSDTSTTAGASSVGIDGGRGMDRIVNEGDINLGLESGYGSIADANAVSVSVTVAGASQGVAGAAALSKSTATGVAETTGIYGGEGNDDVRNAGKISVGAKADVDSTNVALGVTVAKEGLAAGAALSDASALASSTARGIDGAEGDDRIVNTGNIKSKAESHADTTSVTVTIAGTKTGLAGDAALSKTLAQATSAARGIEGAAGNDEIFNEGPIDAKAESYAKTTNVTVNIAGALTGVAGGAALSDSTSASVANATGISGGAGNDRIINKGNIVSGALADSDATGVTAGLTVAKEGVAAGAALSEASSSAISAARGIDGGDGNDRIRNEAKIETRAESHADTVSVTVNLNGTMTGLAGGAALSDSSAQASATARGIEGGAGHDRIRNTGDIDAKSISGTDTTSVTVAISGSLTGVAGGAALSDASAGAVADASGISGGDGNDKIVNAAKITALANANVDTTAVTVGLSVTEEGVAGGAALSNAASSAWSAARGIDGGAGDDRIRNEGVIETTSIASADTVSVAVRVDGSLYGAAGGVAMSDSSAAAIAQSTGILGGAGNDVISSTAKVTAQSTANADATSVSVRGSGSIGLAAGASFSDSSVAALATSRGIDGGEGNDVISNQGELVSRAGATGKSTSVSVSVSLGAGGGASFSDSSALVSADAKGIDGGQGHDRIDNSGAVTATASSDADASSVSVNVGAAVSAGASFGNASVVSIAAARGIDGGEGNDMILNEGKITSGAISRIDADSVSVNVGMGWADAKASIASETTASGIEGGKGDDVIVNRGEILVGPSPGPEFWMSKVTASAFSFGLAGVANAQTSMLATTRSTGIDGGDGNDRILNEGPLNVLATSTSSVSADSVVIFGASSGAVAAGAVAEALGIGGGAGNDSIANTSTISARSVSFMTLDSSSFSFGGTGNTGGMLAAVTRSTGISGGDGSDSIRNDGSITVSALSSLAAGARATVVFGTSKAGSTSGAIAEATGISGGAGDDRIENNGAIQASATAALNQSSSSFSFGGTGVSGATLAATTVAAGISGGDGADIVINRGNMTLQATSYLITQTDSAAAFGSSSGAVTSGAVSQAVGIDGGAGDDRIWNAAALQAGSSSTLDLQSSRFTFGGSSGAKDALTASSLSVGISGGAGANGIRSEGALSVSALSSLTANVDVDAAFGTAKADGVTTSVSTATGLSGGEKEDCIENLAGVGVTSTATAKIEKSSFVFGGSANLKGLVVTSAKAEGIIAGDGDNRILNDLTGTVNVKAESKGEQSGSSTQTFGGPYASADVRAVAAASGLTSGTGDDWIVNRGTFVVDAYAKADGKTSADTFWGSPSAFDYTRAEATATGLDAGGGNNVIISEGSISVKASAETLPTARSDSDVERTLAVAGSVSIATASGIVTGNGRNRIINRGDLTVEALAEKATDDDIRTTASTDEVAHIGGGSATPGIVAEAKAEGIRVGEGNNTIVNEKTIKVTATATGDGKAYAESDMYDTDTIIWGKVSSTATGIAAGKGSSLIINQGALQVDATAGSTTESWSDSVDDATATGGATVAAKAWGINAAGGDITTSQGTTIITNSAPISVTASASATSTSRGDSGIGAGIARTSVDVSAEAWGIAVGSGNQSVSVENAAALTVRAAAEAIAAANGDDSSRSYTNALASAVGVKVGDNTMAFISNSGAITVEADATVNFNTGLTDAKSIGVDVGEGANRIVNSGSIGVTASATGVKARSEATGFRTGGGADQIENRGSLSVRADALALFGSAIASATGIDAGGGDNRVYNYGTLSVTAQPIAILGASDSRARGILTGEGSDTIVNAGKILTSQYTSSLTETPGTAISTGGGNDRVFLEAGSETRGLIDLGSGDDTISFNGQLTVTGSVIGGPGNNTLVFSGDGALEAPISGFETAIKNGPGTYTLSSLAQVKRLEMNGGTLAVNHSYQMPADGVFQARVNGDGSHGQFFVNGVAGLDGSLSVVRGKGVFTNGAKFPILTANTVNGWFTSENLPAPSPLLSFKATGFSNRVEVEALAKSCTTIATNPVQMRVAQMLDKAMATATGSTAEMLGEFQSLPAQDFQKAFASLNPSIYDRFRKASLTASRENLRSLHNRMTALRLTHPDYSAAVQAQTIANTMSLFMTGPDSGMDPDQAWQLGRISSAEARNGSWMSAFGQRGGFAGASGYAGYDYRMNGTVIGYDQRHGETLITGFSNGFNRGEVSIEDKMGLGSISGASSSMYSSWFSDGMYMEGAFSLARNLYTNHRSIVVGSFSQSAASEHEGNLFTAYLSSGRYVDVNQWVVEPYASMLFTQTYEDGFQETGGGLSLRIHDDRTRSLSTDVGLRVARSYEMPFGKLIPEAGVAWIYDFQLDDRSITASFTDVAGSEFSIPGEQTGRHGARFEAGLSLLGNNGLSASLRYTGEFRSGADDQGFFGYLRYEF